MIPPTNSHINAAWDRFFIIEENAKTTSHPMPIYIAEESQWGQLIQQILKMVPTRVIIQTVVSNGIPTDFGKTIRQIGV